VDREGHNSDEAIAHQAVTMEKAVIPGKPERRDDPSLPA
jgi:hypothetical protein